MAATSVLDELSGAAVRDLARLFVDVRLGVSVVVFVVFVAFKPELVVAPLGGHLEGVVAEEYNAFE